MKPSGAELERLISRKPDVVVIERETGDACLLRRDELLVSASDYAAARERAGRWVDTDEALDDLGIARLRLRPSLKVDVEHLTADLRSPARGPLAVTPNYLIKAGPTKWGGPADDPVVVDSAPPLPDPGKPRRDVSVAVLDTGIAQHPWFEGRPWYADCGPDVAEQLDADGDQRLDSQAGHGTFVAGVVLRRAPMSRVRVRRVLDSFGESDEFELLTTLHSLYQWSQATAEPVDVINMSFGYYTLDDQPSPLLADALSRFGDQTALVACAGNYAQQRPFWPAALPGVTAVGALDSDGSAPAPFSNFGTWVDACAVGEHVTSSFVNFDGPKPPTGDFDQDRFTGYAMWSGTSFSAPKVAGAIAAVAADQDLTADQAAQVVLGANGSRKVPGLGVVLDEDPAGAVVA